MGLLLTLLSSSVRVSPRTARDRRSRRVRGCRWAGLIALPLALVAGAACKGEKANAQKGLAGPPAAVIVAEVIRRNVPVFGEYVAQTVANSTVDIPARVEATLEKLLFEEGGAVKKDQILFELDPRTYQAAVQAARAALSKAEADLVYARQQVDTQRVRAPEASGCRERGCSVSARWLSPVTRPPEMRLTRWV